MEQERLSKLLQHFGVRMTPVRLMLYQALEQASIAMSLSDLEVELRTVDKSSIFRNLQLFLEVGLIHQIQDGSGIAKYAVSQIDEVDSPTTHAHFTCRKCAETICLEGITLDLSSLSLPEEYQADGYTLILKGICPHCKHRPPFGK